MDKFLEILNIILSLLKKEHKVEEKKDYQINYKFIKTLEGRSKSPYVPVKKNGEVIGSSGVTIGAGIDLGQHSRASLLSLGVSENLVIKIGPYLGKRGRPALKALKNYYLMFTDKEILELEKIVYNNIIEDLEYFYDREGGTVFKDIPPRAQTVLASLAIQYGPNLNIRTPKTFKYALEQDWKGMIGELNDFGDDFPTRRKREARYLLGIFDK